MLKSVFTVSYLVCRLALARIPHEGVHDELLGGGADFLSRLPQPAARLHARQVEHRLAQRLGPLLPLALHAGENNNIFGTMQLPHTSF